MTSNDNLKTASVQQELETLRELCGQQQSELDTCNQLLGDSAFYIRRMARILEGHPSRIHLRAI